MTLWFIRGIRRGVVTTRYPARPDESAGFLPSPPAFRTGELTREVAAELVAVCPSGALQLAAEILEFDVGACTGCGRCIVAAPRVVIASGEWELATTARSALKKRIPVR
jgi:flavoprotein